MNIVNCKKKKIIITSISVLMILVILLILTYIFTAICPQIDSGIKRTTEFELFSLPKRDDRIGISGKEILLTKSSNLNTNQKNLIYSYIRKIKCIEDKGKPINSYLQASNDDFVIIKFNNGITLYLEPNSSIYSDENIISDCRLSHDEVEFERWFSQLRAELSDFVGISNSEVISIALKYIQNPQKLKDKVSQIGYSKSGMCKINHSQLSKVKMEQYSSDVTIDENLSLDNKQMGKILSIVVLLQGLI